MGGSDDIAKPPKWQARKAFRRGKALQIADKTRLAGNTIGNCIGRQRQPVNLNNHLAIGQGVTVKTRAGDEFGIAKIFRVENKIMGLILHDNSPFIERDYKLT